MARETQTIEDQQTELQEYEALLARVRLCADINAKLWAKIGSLQSEVAGLTAENKRLALQIKRPSRRRQRAVAVAVRYGARVKP